MKTRLRRAPSGPRGAARAQARGERRGHDIATKGSTVGLDAKRDAPARRVEAEPRVGARSTHETGRPRVGVALARLGHDDARLGRAARLALAIATASAVLHREQFTAAHADVCTFKWRDLVSRHPGSKHVREGSQVFFLGHNERAPGPCSPCALRSLDPREPSAIAAMRPPHRPRVTIAHSCVGTPLGTPRRAFDRGTRSSPASTPASPCKPRRTEWSARTCTSGTATRTTHGPKTRSRA